MRVSVAARLLILLVLVQAPPTQNRPPIFRTATRLVQVNVVVHDKHGQPITDLKQQDFTVLERGKPQEIALFSVNGARESEAAPAPLPPHRRCRAPTPRY